MKPCPWLCCFWLLLPMVPVASAEPPRVDALGEPLPPTKDDLARLWDDLGKAARL